MSDDTSESECHDDRRCICAQGFHDPCPIHSAPETDADYRERLSRVTGPLPMHLLAGKNLDAIGRDVGLRRRGHSVAVWDEILKVCGPHEDKT